MIKVIRLTKDWYQADLHGSTYVGDLATMKANFSSIGHNWDTEADVVSLAGIEGIEYENKLPSELNKFCVHNWKEYVGIYLRYNYCSICGIKDETML